MITPERIKDYLQRLTPTARSNLLTELERLEVCNAEMPGSAVILEQLRAEFRNGEQTQKSGHTQRRVANPSRYFFTPLEPLLVNGALEHANSGRRCEIRGEPREHVCGGMAGREPDVR